MSHVEYSQTADNISCVVFSTIQYPWQRWNTINSSHPQSIYPFYAMSVAVPFFQEELQRRLEQLKRHSVRRVSADTALAVGTFMQGSKRLLWLFYLPFLGKKTPGYVLDAPIKLKVINYQCWLCMELTLNPKPCWIRCNLQNRKALQEIAVLEPGTPDFSIHSTRRVISWHFRHRRMS